MWATGSGRAEIDPTDAAVILIHSSVTQKKAKHRPVRIIDVATVPKWLSVLNAAAAATCPPPTYDAATADAKGGGGGPAEPLYMDSFCALWPDRLVVNLYYFPTGGSKTIPLR